MNKKRLLLILSIPVVAVAGIVILLTILTNTTHHNPPVVSEPNWDSPQTRALADRACFDCHSNETAWPIYSVLPGVSQRIAYNVQEGRERLNFSEWGTGHNTNRQTGEMLETIYEGEMPPADYVRLHPEANLNRAEREQLIAGIRATFGSSAGSGEGFAELEEHEEDGEEDD